MGGRTYLVDVPRERMRNAAGEAAVAVAAQANIASRVVSSAPQREGRKRRNEKDSRMREKTNSRWLPLAWPPTL